MVLRGVHSCVKASLNLLETITEPDIGSFIYICIRDHVNIYSSSSVHASKSSLR